MDALGRLLAALARRHRLASGARATARAWCWLAGAATAALIALRLAGWAPPAWPLACTPLLALAWGVLRARPLPAAAAARLADRAGAGDDLLLTAVQADADGAWAATVRAQAATAAARLDAARVLPWRPWPRALGAAGLAILLLAAWRLAPLRDPFRWQERRQQETALAAQQAVARDAVVRLAALAPAAPLSEAAAAQLDRLLAALALPPAAARDTLRDAQRGIERAFSAAQAARLDPQALAQRLGGDDGERRLQEALARGDAGPVQAALAEARRLAQRSAEAPDAAAAPELRRQLERLAEAAAGSPAEAGLRTALDQLARGADPALARAALAALQDQLGVSELELQALAQHGRDAEALREALRTLALARQLDGQGARPGGAATSLAEYRRLYEDAQARLARAAGGTGEPGSGPGIGQGTPATYRDDAATAFDPERSPSVLGAGRQLMSWAAQGPSERGAVREDYRQAAGAVRQAVAEALERERLPPGQEAAVKRYFADTSP